MKSRGKEGAGNGGILERLTFNQRVVGSSPTALTNKKPHEIKDLRGLNIPGQAYAIAPVPTLFPQTRAISSCTNAGS
jgi:hypothetical protein